MGAVNRYKLIGSADFKVLVPYRRCLVGMRHPVVEWEGYIRRTTNPQYTFSELHRYANTGWEAFPTQSPICGRNDGISSRLDDITFPKWRKESIKGYGNAIVPQLVLRIFKAIEDFDSIFKPNS